MVYSENRQASDERKSYCIDELDDIVSVAKDIIFFVQEKWKIATDRPGSGNTKTSDPYL